MCSKYITVIEMSAVYDFNSACRTYRHLRLTIYRGYERDKSRYDNFLAYCIPPTAQYHASTPHV